jgi:hypothetical protein
LLCPDHFLAGLRPLPQKHVQFEGAAADKTPAHPLEGFRSRIRNVCCRNGLINLLPNLVETRSVARALRFAPATAHVGPADRPGENRSCPT